MTTACESKSPGAFAPGLQEQMLLGNSGLDIDLRINQAYLKGPGNLRDLVIQEQMDAKIHYDKIVSGA